MDVDFKRLASFMWIADLGSLSRAADRMRVAQPALSRQMRLLEAELGVALFARHRRGMSLTPAGEELRSRLVGPLRQIDMVIEDIRSLSSEVAGNIAIGVPPTVSLVLAGSLAKRVVSQAPNVSLRVVEGYAAHLVDWLQRGEIDVAILYGPAADLQLKTEELLVEDICLVGSAESHLSAAKSIEFRELTKLPLILPSRPHGLRVVADNAAAKAKMRLDVRFQADSFVLMKELVESDLGYSMMPYSAVAREVEAGRLCWAPIVNPIVRRQLVLATHPGATSRTAQTLTKIIRREISELVNSGRWSAQILFEKNSLE
ncbi:LysR family transcriptional regulator [Sphingobium indicum]|uniref:LysR family transcriptional regulator n=1 Tax=Sphingobium indicum TaxID=332055 RepID=UPI000684540B|nr:LysR substrate-binding domain-containing protein [Sphingobium indicum]